MGGQQTGRTGADHGGPAPTWRGAAQNVLGRTDLDLGEEPLDIPDPDCPVELEAFAVELARVGAHVPEDPREWELLANRLQRFAVATGSCELDVQVCIDP